MKGILKRGFEDAHGIEARRSVLAGVEIELAQRLNEKHRSTGSTGWMIRGGGGKTNRKYIKIA